MLEVLLVCAALLGVAIVGVVTTLVTPERMTELGLLGLVVGLVTGVPAGLWYHLVLYRLLTRTMALPPKWWLSPVDLHPRLAGEDLARIRPWFLLGGIGFVLSIIGGVAAMAGLLLAG